jgi:prophage antirepressor-like protein
MSEEMQVFTNPDFGDIRTATIDREPWFVGRDVAKALGYANPLKAVRDHIDEEDRTVNESFTVNGTALTLINESGLYSLILSSKLPAAKKFKRWVTAEVLPTLRKTGRYNIVTTPAVTEQRALTTDDYLKAAQIVASCRNERLPYVMHYLECGGFEKPHISETETSAVGDSAQALQLILDAKSIYGMSNAQIGRIVGLDRVQVGRYVNGQNGMSAHRAARVINQLSDALSQVSTASTE